MSDMKALSIEKVCLNVGVGEAGDALEKAKKLIERLTGSKAVLTKGKKKIPAFKVRPGLPIGVKITLRKNFNDLLVRLLESVENTLLESSFNGRSVSFGIDEYIHIPGVDYDPQIGIFGMDVSVSLKRPGLRITKRKLKRALIGKRHVITTQDSMDYFKNNFKVNVVKQK